MKIWQQDVTIELLNHRGENSLSDFLKIEFTEMGDDYMKVKMPISGRHRQPLGIMHGGVSCVLAETVGSTAANFCVPTSHYCVGLDINTNHIRSIKEGWLTAVATPFHIGKSTQVWGIDIKNEAEQRISINRLTLAVLKREF